MEDRVVGGDGGGVSPDAGHESEEERLYDAYLAAALGGGPLDPSAFLGGTAVSETLRSRLDALHAANLRARAQRAAGGTLPHAPRPAEPGLPFERLGEFRLLRRLGEGGMGAVYLAEQESLGRVVALKVLRPELRGSPTADARLEREALAVARLSHRHIVQVHAVGEDRGVRYLAMEYVEGRGLDEVLADGVPPAADVLRWGAEVARALACAHAASIVHRDVKPSNVRIGSDGRAMLLDFGVARALDAPALTLTGPMVGTPLYAAPEQAAGAGAVVDARTDVYGLGVTLYECLAGRPPFAGTTTEAVLRQVLAGDPPPLRKVVRGVSRDVEVVVAKAMARAPSNRYATAEEFAEDLEALLSFRPVRARPPSAASRLANWARRRPGPAAMVATAAVAAVAWAALAANQARAADAQRRADAAKAVADAETRLADWRAAREGSAALEAEVRRLSDLLFSEYLPDERLALLDATESKAADARRRRETAYYEVLELLARAERLDPDVQGAASARTRLHLERWREAVAARNAGEAAFYRDLVLARDADGAAAREIRGACTVRMGVAAADAEAYVFRYRVHSEVVPGGESRFVPVPLQETPPAVAPGTRVLVVTRGAGDVKKGDLVLSLGGKPVASLPPREAVALAETGGAAASVHRDGRVLDATLPAGLRVRATAAPLALSPACRRPASPRLEFSGEPGEYLVLVRAPGREDQRVFFDAAPNAVLERAIALAPEGAAAPDFVRVHTMRIDPPFWVLDREVTAAEYLEFLNDPATLAEIAASAAPIRFPRDNSTEHSGGYWPRDAGGRYSLAENLPESAPVLGVSQDDARAYAAWFGRRIGAAERGLVARLPLQEEHATAAGQSSIRNFPFGVTFRPRWAKSCYSTPKPGLEAGLSYPVDESPYAVFDCSGGAREWTDERDRGLGRLCGGSWAIASPDNFQIWYSVRTLPAQGSSQSGFRLVLVPADGRR